MSSIDEVSAAIGGLKVQTSALVKNAAEQNREIRGIREELRAVSEAMATIKADVAEFKPVARKVRNWEQRAVGMSLVGGVLGSGAFAWLGGWFRGWIS